MATRSTIAVLNPNGTVSQIYCHWDGYLEWNGRILVENYNTLERVQELIALGDLSSLHENIQSTTDSQTCEDPEPNVGVYYGRDRGESGVEPRVYDSLEDYIENFQREEFNYLFQAGEWTYTEDSTGSVFRSVKDDLNNLQSDRDEDE